MYNKHLFPIGVTTGKEFFDKWVWEPAEWEMCDCGFYHSNRCIPDSYWNKWRNKPRNEKQNINHKNGIILVRGNKDVFVTQSYWNYFGFPKGSSEKNESPLFGALREFYEETGCDLDKVLNKDFTKTDQIYWYNLNKKIQYSFFIVNVPWWFDIVTKPLDDVEITSYGWVSLYNITSLKLSKDMREIYTQFIEIKNSSNYTEFINTRNKRLNKTHKF